MSYDVDRFFEMEECRGISPRRLIAAYSATDIFMSYVAGFSNEIAGPSQKNHPPARIIENPDGLARTIFNTVFVHHSESTGGAPVILEKSSQGGSGVVPQKLC